MIQFDAYFWNNGWLNHPLVFCCCSKISHMFAPMSWLVDLEHFHKKKTMKIPIRIFFQNCVCFGFGYLQMFTEVFMAFFHILFLQRLYGSLIFRRANVIHSMSFTGVTQVLQALSLKQRYLACEMIDFTRCCYTNIATFSFLTTVNASAGTVFQTQPF